MMLEQRWTPMLEGAGKGERREGGVRQAAKPRVNFIYAVFFSAMSLLLMKWASVRGGRKGRESR